MKYLVIVTGPTGIGKTNLSIQLAKELDCEIVSADSRQIYKEMCIGTAVPTEEELFQVKHHLIQTISVDEYYNVSRYENEALNVIKRLHCHKNVVILTGGTGLYIESICKGIDRMPNPNPNIRASLNKKFRKYGIKSLQEDLKKVDIDYYNQVDLNNHMRLIRSLEIYYQTGKPYSKYRKTTAKKRPFKTIKIALNMDRNKLYERINLRVDKMIEEGQIEEAKSLYSKKHLSSLKTVGYQELFEYFNGNITLETAIEKIKNSSRKYARKQISWIRRDHDYQWFNPSDKEAIIKHVKTQIKEV